MMNGGEQGLKNRQQSHRRKGSHTPLTFLRSLGIMRQQIRIGRALRAPPMMRFLIILSLVLVLAPACRKADEQPPPSGRKWTEREIRTLQGKTREEVKDLLGRPDGFYTRSAEGRWHYSNILLDNEGAGPPRRVWVIVYFSQFGERRATIIEIHEHIEGE